MKRAVMQIGSVANTFGTLEHADHVIKIALVGGQSTTIIVLTHDNFKIIV
jgi:hypothetical protein